MNVENSQCDYSCAFERHVRHCQRELSAEDAAGAENDKLYDKLCRHMLAL